MNALPYKDRGKVLKQGGEVALLDLHLSVWPLANPQATPSGEAYEWEGQAEAEHADELVGRANRSIELTAGTFSGRRLKIVSAVEHEFIPHVELRLREVRGS